MLEVDGLHVHYGHVHALRGLSLRVAEGEMVALLGGNGAGKTTTLAAISGLVRPSGGRITLLSRDVTRARPWELVDQGVVQVPEGRRVFSTLSVHENLQLGGYRTRSPAALRDRIERVYALFPRLAERRRQQAGTLSGGEQQMLAIGRALVARPRLLMLDEPSMGLAPLLVAAVMAVLVEINVAGTAILLVEQNATAALKVAHRGYVIENGVGVLAGSADTLLTDRRVVEAYLGGGPQR
jgi:branched-chain amino acid transport system ATP-binding protein